MSKSKKESLVEMPKKQEQREEPKIHFAKYLTIVTLPYSVRVWVSAQYRNKEMFTKEQWDQIVEKERSRRSG